ncbi:GlsB/YeaQ/YmgE family stress response membrane protein [Melissococcus plutonius]|uniref:Transglycosylase-associated protein n=1 Tax=Melissococcus plutonius TaxID=33970 RepID=A0A2Z5Y169_9ENTE|nr:GlsB/YeaQ/YmgE family stress response membrane protein [Melissococcus plutonius]BAL61675.1 hypothetical protein MPD5_0400 [Melissococcus plutonius DAT561]MCV2498378.1 GlsB/YeaQ/YmgE family stress response membrane protein [Melissococcus plutonius]MCV2500407.1 GlsB/YeaQ/YmgE family stress response membrane protein [Melissococcus plutonius]MCV2504511.1 GlsB/YeaQ/YmgE family stress response membrane protein [Melissococcus plutonius]MCV2506993.1 GlsB/YeaQ/YmgE family stress response membrane pr
MLSFIWSLIVGGILGAIAGAIVGRDVPGGIVGNIIVGFLGSWVGTKLLGNMGMVIGGFPIISAFIGALICVVIYSIIIKVVS